MPTCLPHPGLSQVPQTQHVWNLLIPFNQPLFVGFVLVNAANSIFLFALARYPGVIFPPFSFKIAVLKVYSSYNTGFSGMLQSPLPKIVCCTCPSDLWICEISGTRASSEFGPESRDRNRQNNFRNLKQETTVFLRQMLSLLFNVWVIN